eukprot:1976109-Rhodomonas_salina.1
MRFLVFDQDCGFLYLITSGGRKLEASAHRTELGKGFGVQDAGVGLGVDSNRRGGFKFCAVLKSLKRGCQVTAFARVERISPELKHKSPQSPYCAPQESGCLYWISQRRPTAARAGGRKGRKKLLLLPARTLCAGPSSAPLLPATTELDCPCPRMLEHLMVGELEHLMGGEARRGEPKPTASPLLPAPALAPRRQERACTRCSHSAGSAPASLPCGKERGGTRGHGRRGQSRKERSADGAKTNVPWFGFLKAEEDRVRRGTSGSSTSHATP